MARAIVQGAKVVLPDEPIASLDPESSRKVMDILDRVNRGDKCTVVVLFRQVNAAIKYCPRTVALHQGKVVYDGPSVGLTPALLRDLYAAEADDILALGDHISSLEDKARPVPHLAGRCPWHRPPEAIFYYPVQLIQEISMIKKLRAGLAASG